jgi:hypothetical protein
MNDEPLEDWYVSGPGCDMQATFTKHADFCM